MGFFLSFFGGSAAVTSWRCFGDRAWWMWCFASAAASDSESAASLASIGAFFSFFSSLLQQQYRARVALCELGFACLLLLKQQQHAWCVCSKLYDALFYLIIKPQFVNE